MTQQIKTPLFPLAGVILFPTMQVPLHIFEPRYQAMINESIARDRMIGLIQPQSNLDQQSPTLYSIGCLGRMVDIEAMDDGRYNIILEGVARFNIDKELDVKTAFRQAEITLWDETEDQEALSSVERASLEMESRRFADNLGYSVDWEAVTQLDDMALVNAIAQVAPFDSAAKQACLETKTLAARAELIIQLMQFFGRHDDDSNRVTLQ